MRWFNILFDAVGFAMLLAVIWLALAFAETFL